jgi:hypothetical protein
VPLIARQHLQLVAPIVDSQIIQGTQHVHSYQQCRPIFQAPGVEDIKVAESDGKAVNGRRPQMNLGYARDLAQLRGLRGVGDRSLKLLRAAVVAMR